MADDSDTTSDEVKPAVERRKKTGGRQPTLKVPLVAAALVEHHGNLTRVAAKFDVHRSSVKELIDKTPDLVAVLHDAREGFVDEAEDSLRAAVLEGEAWAVSLVVKTLGKARGYVERQEMTGADGRQLTQTVIYMPRNGRDEPADEESK